ncbi:MAG: hypothetical protein II771_01335 [Clostridia bacterium]|nr:hypothetical protein [Clostridia bacterium]
MKKVILKKNRYVDSVSLMGIGDKVKALGGIENAETSMGSAANIEVLEDLGYTVPEDTTPNDLMIAITAESEAKWDEACKLIMDVIDHKTTGEEGAVSYKSLSEIDLREDGYDLAQISLPGEYAAEEAKRAIAMGLDVFIFSDNVSLDEELEIKEFGAKHGKLVMGPDAGVGLIKGVALAAGSIIRRGPVGIVAASGSGAQEVGCLVEQYGLGVSSIIGTGGHDLLPKIGGITMLAGMHRLEADPDTELIVLVSKLADLAVMDKILGEADKLRKPVVAIFLGADEKLFEGHKVHPAYSLEGAAIEAVKLITGKAPAVGFSDAEIRAIVDREMKLYRPEQKYVRGLFSGGTFTEEGMIYYTQHNKGVKLYSNLNTKYAEQIKDHNVSVGHCILDLGAEDFTAEAPHPIFDPALKLKRLNRELEDDSVAVVTMDFITGPGVHLDPVRPFAEACKKILAERRDHVTFIANICGSLEDPQDVPACKKMLSDAGVIVTASNYESTKLASALMAALENR